MKFTSLASLVAVASAGPTLNFKDKGSSPPHECSITKTTGKHELVTDCAMSFPGGSSMDKLKDMLERVARNNAYCPKTLSTKTNEEFLESIDATGLLPDEDDLEERELDRVFYAQCKPGYWDAALDTNVIKFTCSGNGKWARSGANCKKIECPKSYACSSGDCGAGSLPSSSKILYPPLVKDEETVSIERSVQCKPGHGFGGDSSFHGTPVTMKCILWRPYLSDASGKTIAGKPGTAIWYHDHKPSDSSLNTCKEYVCKETTSTYTGWKGSKTTLKFPALVQSGAPQKVDCDPHDRSAYDGAVTRSCDINGVSRFHGTCSEKSCDALRSYAVRHPNPAYSDTFKITIGKSMHSQQHTIPCSSANSAFNTGAITIKCNDKTHGKWTNGKEDDYTIDVSQCRKRCNPSLLSAFTVSGVTTADCNHKHGGDSCVIRCNTGSASTVARCGYNGQWSSNPRAPSCAFQFKFSHMSNGRRNYGRETNYYEAHSVGTSGVGYPSSGGAGQCRRSDYWWGGSYYGRPSGRYAQTAHGDWDGDNIDHLKAQVSGNRINFNLVHFHRSTGYFTGAYGVQAKCWLFRDNSRINTFLGHKFGGYWGTIRRSQSFSHTFSSKGTYYVRCGVHDLSGCRQGFDNNPSFTCANANSGCGWDHHYDNVQMKIEIN